MALPRSQRPDLWNLIFFRVQQVAGLALIGYEAVLRPMGAQTPVLLVGVALALGPTGLRLLLRGGSDLLREAAKEIPDERRPDDAEIH